MTRKLYLVKNMDDDDRVIKDLFDAAVHSDRERMAKILLKSYPYGISFPQLSADGVRIAGVERVESILDELVLAGAVVRYNYRNHTPLYFHKDNTCHEPTTRRTFNLLIAA